MAQFPTGIKYRGLRNNMPITNESSSSCNVSEFPVKFYVGGARLPNFIADMAT